MKPPTLRWLMIDGEADAHCITDEDPSGRGWRPLCQQSDLASERLLRDARDGIDTFCTTCRTVYGSRTVRLLPVALPPRRR